MAGPPKSRRLVRVAASITDASTRAGGPAGSLAVNPAGYRQYGAGRDCSGAPSLPTLTLAGRSSRPAIR